MRPPSNLRTLLVPSPLLTLPMTNECNFTGWPFAAIESWAFDHLHPTYNLVSRLLWRNDDGVPMKRNSDGF